MKHTGLSTKRYPARRGFARALAVAVFALALFVLATTVPLGGARTPSATPRPLVTATPVAPTIQAVPTPDSAEQPKPGFATPDMGESGTASIIVPAQDWYMIQLGAYSTSDAAAAQAKLYTGRGAAGYMLEDDKFRVLAAAYDTRDDAEVIKARLKDVQGLDTYVYHVTTDELELSVTAASGQVQALREGFDVVLLAMREMGRLSTELDKQRMDGADIIQAAQALRLEAQDRQRALEERLGGNASAIVRGLGDLLTMTDRGLEAICAQNAQETIAMTSKIKYNQIDLIWHVIGYIRQISAQQA